MSGDTKNMANMANKALNRETYDKQVELMLTLCLSTRRLGAHCMLGNSQLTGVVYRNVQLSVCDGKDEGWDVKRMHALDVCEKYTLAK